MADSGGSDGDERGHVGGHVGGDGDGFIKDNVTGEEIDQNALQDSQEQISFDQFNTFPGTTQQTTPNDLFNPVISSVFCQTYLDLIILGRCKSTYKSTSATSSGPATSVSSISSTATTFTAATRVKWKWFFAFK